MKKLLIIILCILSGSILNAQEMKLDELLEKYYKASGQDKLTKVKTVKTTGKMIQNGMEFQMTSIEKRPDKDRTEIEIQGTRIIMVMDGNTGWMINPVTGSFDPQDLSPEMIKSTEKENRNDPYGSWSNPFVNWKESGTQIELVGKEDMNGTPVYNLKVTFKDKEVKNYYIDVTRLVVLALKGKAEIQGQMYDVESRFSNITDVDGIPNPFKLESFYNGALNLSVTIEKIEYNLPIDEGMFKKPVVEKK